MKAAIYVRISRDAEDTGLGVARQEKECRALAKRKGWRVAEIYSDNDRSAFNGHRREWERLLADVESGKVGAVVSWSNDRLYRDVDDQRRLLKALMATGGMLTTVRDGELDLDSDSGPFVMGLLAQAAEFESRRKSARQKSKHAELREKGLWSGSRAPFGFALRKMESGTTLDVVAAEAEAIRDAAARVLDGESLRSIARRWNAAGFRTARGRVWDYRGVRSAVTREAVAGLRAGQAATWEPILDRRTWHDVKAALAEPKPGAKRGGKWLLTGLLECVVCGSPMHAQSRSSGSRTYCCATRAHVRIRAEELEEYILGEARGRGERVTKVRDPLEVEEGLRRELDDIQSRLIEWAMEAGKTGMSPAEFRAVREPLVARREELEGQIRKVAIVVTYTDERGRKIADFGATAEARKRARARPDDDPRGMLERKVAVIRVRPAGRSRWVPVADRVEIEWQS